MFTIASLARRNQCKLTIYCNFGRYFAIHQVARMSQNVECPWNYIYIAGLDNPIYLKRQKSMQTESESRRTKVVSKLFDTACRKFLIFSTDQSQGFPQKHYIASAIHSHKIYRQNGIWPFTVFAHSVLFGNFSSENGSHLKRGVFCCSMSVDHHVHVRTEIINFLKNSDNGLLAYEMYESNNGFYKMRVISDDDDDDYQSDDNNEIELRLVDRSDITDLQEASSTASPIFSFPGISPVFNCYSDARVILDQLSDVPEVKELMDIADKCVAMETEMSCKQSLVHPFVVVEGMDATGKTTLTELLEKKMGAARYFTPPAQITHTREFFDKYPEIVRCAYYSVGNYIVAQEIVQACQNTPVIMDRFWHSTAAYGIANETSSGDMPEVNHCTYIWPCDLLKPTIVLLLTVSEDVRKQRLSGRGVQATFQERSLDKDQLFRNRLCDAYKRMNDPSCVEIDAGGTVDEVFNEALQTLAAHGVNIHSQ